MHKYIIFNMFQPQNDKVKAEFWKLFADFLKKKD